MRVEKNALLMCEKLWGEIYICNDPNRKIMPISPHFKIILADCGQRENLLNLHASWGFPGGKESACQGRRVQCLGWEDHLEKEMETHSSILAWKIPWTEEPAGLQFTGSERVRRD